MGRPKLPEGEAYSERIAVRIRRDEFEVLEEIAAEHGVPVGQVARELLQQAIARRR